MIPGSFADLIDSTLSSGLPVDLRALPECFRRVSFDWTSEPLFDLWSVEPTAASPGAATERGDALAKQVGECARANNLPNLISDVVLVILARAQRDRRPLQMLEVAFITRVAQRAYLAAFN